MAVIVKNGRYDQKLVAKAYHEWFLSKPFDIGNTISRTVQNSTAIDMINAATRYNKGSLNNGFLMRLPGIIALYYNKPLKDLLSVIIYDTMLTHSNSEAKRVALIYGVLLYNAIDGKNATDLCKIVKTEVVIRH